MYSKLYIMLKTILGIIALIVIVLAVGVFMRQDKKINSANNHDSQMNDEENKSFNEVQDKESESNGTPGKIIKSKEREEAFRKDGLKTNTAIRSIPLDEVLGGGPGKDGIPAILNPKFISINAAKKIEDGDRFGVSVTVGDTSRFYPYSILVWHEIVNDEINNQPFIVTFCPLCGSAITFDPRVDGEVRTFGVSGKLWESNLLMYDHKNENLWSQIIGEVVVGDDTGKKLEIFPSQLIMFDAFVSAHPNGEVLSRDTGHNRNYGFYPYGNYDNSESLYFPVSVQDNRLFAKELMFIVNVGDFSGAFKRSDLLEAGSASLQIEDTTVTVKVDGEELKATDQNGNKVAGYIAMWFSWAAHHQDNSFVWSK